MKTPASTCLTLTLGQLVHDKDGEAWVYIGYRKTTAARQSHRFAHCMTGKQFFMDWFYEAVFADTLINKFLDLRRSLKAGYVYDLDKKQVVQQGEDNGPE